MVGGLEYWGRGIYIFSKLFFFKYIKTPKKAIFNFSIGFNPLVGSGGKGWGEGICKNANGG